MSKVLNFFYGFAIAIGFVLILGSVGSDCDGACMENAMPIKDVFMYSVAGFALIALGVVGFKKGIE
jgi:hypothetical protein